MLKSISEALTWRVMNDVDFICWTEKKLVILPGSWLWQTVIFLQIHLTIQGQFLPAVSLFPVCCLYWGICRLNTECFLRRRGCFGSDSGLCTMTNTRSISVCRLIFFQSGFITHNHFLLLYSSETLRKRVSWMIISYKFTTLDAFLRHFWEYSSVFYSVSCINILHALAQANYEMFPCTEETT